MNLPASLRFHVLVCCLSLVCGSLGNGHGAHAQAANEQPGFVRVQGTHFSLDGAPFRFLGANVSVMHGPRERRAYEAVLDAVVADGLKVVRLWALGEQLAPGEPHHPLYAFRIGESGWVEESFVHLDRVLAAAKARGLKVIVVLANRWKDYGGIATYLRWAGVTVQRDAQGEPLGSALHAFFNCAACQSQYREHVERVVGRVNSITREAYRDDPTILGWELINEASAVAAREEEALLSWVQSTARLIRSLDPNHLISAGHIGYQTTRERKVWQAVQSLPEIDFADAHLYPLTDVRIAHVGHLARLLDDPMALAQSALRKPLVFGEFGFEPASGRAGYVERRRWIEAFLVHFIKRPGTGALVWLYEPADNPARAHTISENPADRSARYVRRALRSASRRLASSAPARVPRAWTDASRLRPFARLHDERGAGVQRTLTHIAGGAVLDIDPAAFARARFERLGVYVGHAFETVWGQGEGYVEYHLGLPRQVPRSLRIDARVSSELPGAGDGSDSRDGSDIEISLDGEVLGCVRAKPDDGLGDVVSVELSDPWLLRRLFRPRRMHVLRFRALPSLYAGGLCLYGRPTGVQPIPQAALREITTVRLTLQNP